MQLKYLPSIKSPSDLKKLGSEELHTLCEELRFYTINTTDSIKPNVIFILGG